VKNSQALQAYGDQMSEMLVSGADTPVVAPVVAKAESTLTDRDREILAFERRWWKYAGAKEEAARELFDLTATRYYQVLNTLIDSPAALEHDPMLVKRLRRVRSTRQRARSTRRLADENH
jgi:hypothetical protein